MGAESALLSELPHRILVRVDIRFDA